MIKLETVSQRTFKKVVDMKLPPEQNRFVAPNVVSLAQAWLDYEAARPFAICLDDEVVGFMMLDWDEGERTVGLWRLMIAPEHQHHGYGREALSSAIKMARESGIIDMMHLDYVPGNTVARELYYSLGFRENGDVEDGEIIMTLPLTDKPKAGMLTADEDDLEEFSELIAGERDNGTLIPPAFESETVLRDAVIEGKIKRFTVMGETAGISDGNAFLIFSEFSDYSEEIAERNRQ